MTSRVVSLVFASAVVSTTLGVVPSHAQTPAGSPAPAEEGTQITLVGCVQREADYRRAQDRGRGSAGTGFGQGNEYVLINASRPGSDAAGADTRIDCSQQAAGEAYELTGKRETELERFVGRAVRLSGTLKESELEAAGTPEAAGGTRPTGGFDPLGQDLRLHEVDVASFQEMTAQTTAAPPAAEPATPETETAARTTGEPEELPGTASPLPVVGLVGLLALGTALGLRAVRRR